MGPSTRIVAVDVAPLDVPLEDPFVIATGAARRAEVAFVRVRLAGGAEGFGEIAPLQPITGETREASVAAARHLGETLTGEDAAAWRAVGERLAELAPAAPAARAALECAVVDALAVAHGMPLDVLFGGAALETDLETDVTLPLLDDARVDTLAARWWQRGFRRFKLKAGGGGPEVDLHRLRRLAERFPGVDFVVDANGGWDEAGALAFVRELGELAGRVAAIEQPVPREDVEALARVRAASAAPVLADEAAATLPAVRALVAAGAADGVNVKIVRSGLGEALDIARFARGAGLRLMVGGMIETRLGMGFTLALARGVGGVSIVDLDTPLLMRDDPVAGGFAYRGARLVPPRAPGVGARPRPWADPCTPTGGALA